MSQMKVHYTRCMFSYQQKLQTNLSRACFMKYILLQTHQWMRVSLISCYSFVRSIFVGFNFIFFFYTIQLLDCILVRVYCTEHDPIYLILAEKFFFTIVKIVIYQQKYFTKEKLGIFSQVWHLIVLIPDLCTLTYFYE